MTTDDTTPPEGTPDPPEGAEPPEGTPEGRTANAEAARYRHQLRAVETERDALRGTVERLQLADVARLTEGKLAQPDDFFTVGGTVLTDLLGEDGSVDSGLVETALTGLLQARPGLAYVPPRPAGPSAFGLGARGGAVGEQATWQDVVRGK